MHETKVKLKNGDELCGAIWMWRPTEGFFTLIGEDSEKKICLRDIASAVTEGVRISATEVRDRDELERARENGWDGT